MPSWPFGDPASALIDSASRRSAASGAGSATPRTSRLAAAKASGDPARSWATTSSATLGQVGGRYDARDQAGVEGLLRGQHVSEQRQPQHPVQPEGVDQEAAAAVGAQAHLRVGEAELRRVGGEHDVRGRRQREAATGSGAVHHADHDRVTADQLGDDPVDGLGEVEQKRRRVVGSGERAEVAAHGEEPALGGKHDDPGAVGLRPQHRLVQLLGRRRLDRVAPVARGQRDPGRAVGIGVGDVLVGHGGPSGGGCQAAHSWVSTSESLTLPSAALSATCSAVRA